MHKKEIKFDECCNKVGEVDFPWSSGMRKRVFQ